MAEAAYNQQPTVLNRTGSKSHTSKTRQLDLIAVLRGCSPQSGVSAKEGLGSNAGEASPPSARTVTTVDRTGRHADGGNLDLNVSKNGARSWVFMFKMVGRQREMGLGSARDVPLATARELAAAARKTVAEGRDPLRTKAETAVKTLGGCAYAYVVAMQPG